MRRGKRLTHFLTSVLLVIGPVATSADENVIIRDRRAPASSSQPSYFSSLVTKYVPSSLTKSRYSPFSSSKGKEVSHFISSPKALKNHLGYSSYPSDSSGSSSSYSYSSDAFPSSSSILSSIKSSGRGWGWGSKPSSGWSSGPGWSWGKPHGYEVAIYDKGSVIGDFLDAALFVKVAFLKTLFLVAGTAVAGTGVGVTGIAVLLAKLWIIKHGFGVCGIITALPFCPCAIKSYCAPYRCKLFGGFGGPGCWGGGWGGFGFPFGSPFGC